MQGPSTIKVFTGIMGFLFSDQLDSFDVFNGFKEATVVQKARSRYGEVTRRGCFIVPSISIDEKNRILIRVQIHWDRSIPRVALDMVLEEVW